MSNRKLLLHDIINRFNQTSAPINPTTQEMMLADILLRLRELQINMDALILREKLAPRKPDPGMVRGLDL